VYALAIGSHQPAFFPLTNAGERNMVHLTGAGLDVIPPQRPNSMGVDVFMDEAARQPGFFTLSAAGNTDSVIVAMNADRRESELALWDMKTLHQAWKGANIHWENRTQAGQIAHSDTPDFPLWKLCVILALIMLAVESFFLTGNIFKSTFSTAQ
jgi:hypothetical protein